MVEGLRRCKSLKKSKKHAGTVQKLEMGTYICSLSAYVGAHQSLGVSDFGRLPGIAFPHLGYGEVNGSESFQSQSEQFWLPEYIALIV